ncbi:MAG TPA: hypothetical protein VNV60_05020 [Holophagaceae bacterium]|jgi:hypothetical protein|nr:hypothetical protein [Holophagaceae bacterium]
MLSPSHRGSRWLSWIAGLLAIGTMLVLSVVFRVTENRGKAWPILQTVAARLATDEGARDLYAKNPQLADSYASADTFVEAVRAHRAAFGALPDREPDADRKDYEADSDPDGLRAFVKGTGGAWMSLGLERSDGTEAGHAAVGEGITFLGFGESVSKLKDLRSAMRAAFAERLWSQFMAVERSLLTEEGTEALLQANPSLAGDDAARTAFLQRARTWRPRLAASAPPATWAEAEKAPDDVVHFMRHNRPIFGERAEVGWKPKDGAWLQIGWENGRLVKVVLED